MQRRFISPELSTSDEEDPLINSTQPLPSLDVSLTSFFVNQATRNLHSNVLSPLQQENDDDIPSELESEGSLPPLDTDGPAWSTPVIGTKEEKKAILRKKAIKNKKYHCNAAGRSKALAASELEEDVEEVLNLLEEKGLHFGQFLKFIFDTIQGIQKGMYDGISSSHTLARRQKFWTGGYHQRTVTRQGMRSKNGL